MRKSIYIILALLLYSSCPELQAQGNQKILFRKVFGGSRFDEAKKVLALQDNSILVLGRSSSGEVGNTDLHILKLSSDGTLIWEQKIGGDGTEEVQDIIQTKDGGFIIAGNSDSFDRSPEMHDMWILKLNKKGVEEWSKTYGDELKIEKANAIVESHSKGYTIVGNVLDLESENPISNVILLEIDSEGNKLWEKVYGGNSNEEGKDLVKTEQGYTIAANTESFGRGKWDVWLLSVDVKGNKLWENTLGGGDNEMVNAIVKTKDDEYIIGGYSYTFAEGSLDAWVVKTNNKGFQEWFRVYGDLSTDEAFSIIQTEDQNFLLTGYVDVWQSNEEGQNISTEGLDILLVKFDSKGKLFWKRNLGGPNEQRGYDLCETKDHKIVIAGFTKSAKNSNGDMLVVKVEP